MKLTKTKLQQLIREELTAAMEHLDTKPAAEPGERSEFSRRLSVVNSELRELVDLVDRVGVWPHPEESTQQRLEDMLMNILDKHVPRLQEMAHESGLAWAPNEADTDDDEETGPESAIPGWGAGMANANWLKGKGQQED